MVVALASFSVWVYADLRAQRDSNEGFRRQLDTLNTYFDSYVATHNYSNSEYEDYVANHQYTDSEYEGYVAGHQYTNAEYEEARFFFYYTKPDGQKFGVDDLDAFLQGLEWSKPYQEDVFDCSEMGAALERILENEGWNAVIVVGGSPFGGAPHAWLLVETSEGGYMPVEATTIRVVWWDDPYFDGYFSYDVGFETIQEAIASSESEFDWWNS